MFYAYSFIAKMDRIGTLCIKLLFIGIFFLHSIGR